MELTETQLSQKIYWEDMFELMEEQQECWKQMYTMFQQLQYQGADPRLLEQFSLTINQMAEAFKSLELLEYCFPQQPRAPLASGSLPSLTNSPGPFKY